MRKYLLTLGWILASFLSFQFYSPVTLANDQSSLTKSEVTQAIASAEKARKKAASVGYEWRDTRKLIKQAKKALKANQLKKALSLAKQAKFQGNAAYEQSQEIAKSWQNAVPK